MKQTLLIIFPFIFLSFVARDKMKRSYESSDFKCSYETTDGRLDGNYVSYYNNGQKKSEGKFANNYRIGKWTVWDSTGRIRMQRDYSDAFTFKRIIPKVAKDKVIKLLNVPQYSLKYNKDGFLEYFYLRERAVLYIHRNWRFVEPNENRLLFEKDKLFSILNKNIFNKNITPYKVTNEDFLEELLVTDIDTASIEIIGFKIKEDYFFDNERLVSETRIMGICPVGFSKLKQDTVDLYWVYFPYIRKYLAQEKIQQSGLPAKIKTFDDLFFYRYFYGQIYKESNIYDKPISAYKSGKEIEQEAEKIELDLIEREHDIWLTLTE